MKASIALAERVCPRCGEPRATAEFHRDRTRGERGRQSWCIDCKAGLDRGRSRDMKTEKQQRKWRTINREQLVREHRQPRPVVEDYLRPKTRADCADGPRPCPFVGCEFHTYLHLDSRSGSMHLAGDDPLEMTETCVLDVADRGGATLEEIGAMLGVTREAIRQTEVKALGKLLPQVLRAGLSVEDVGEDGPTPWDATTKCQVRK